MKALDSVKPELPALFSSKQAPGVEEAWMRWDAKQDATFKKYPVLSRYYYWTDGPDKRLARLQVGKAYGLTGLGLAGAGTGAYALGKKLQNQDKTAAELGFTKTAFPAKDTLRYIKDGLTLKPLRDIKQWEKGKAEMEYLNRFSPLKTRTSDATASPVQQDVAKWLDNKNNAVLKKYPVLNQYPANGDGPAKHTALRQVAKAYGLAGAGLGAGGVGLYALAKKLRNSDEVK